jgi:predicted SprT family Zn-dependent metalloprotease
MTTEQLQSLPSYEPLKRNGLNDENIRQFYTLPKEQRGVFLNSFKINVAPTRMDTSTVAVKEEVTQMCTKDLYESVNAELKRLMGKTFEYRGKTFNLIEMGYTFGWNNNKTRFGVHKTSWRSFLGDRKYTKMRIELSKYCLEYSSKQFNDWVDTILHEIAHGIDHAVRGESNHDGHWRGIALHIGCNGERCGSFKISSKAPSKYTIKCNSCGNERRGHKYSSKIVKGYVSCGKCMANKFDSRYLLEQIQNY